MLEYVDVAAVAAYFSEASGPSPSTDLAGALVVLWRPGLQIKPGRKHSGSSWSERRSWKLWARARIILLWLYLWMSLLMFTGRFLERLYILLFHSGGCLVVFQETVASSSAPAQATANGVMLYVAALIIDAQEVRQTGTSFGIFFGNGLPVCCRKRW